MLSAFNFRDKREDNIVQMRNVHGPKTKALDNHTDEGSEGWPEASENRNRETIVARGRVGIRRFEHRLDLLHR